MRHGAPVGVLGSQQRWSEKARRRETGGGGGGERRRRCSDRGNGEDEGWLASRDQGEAS